MDLADTGTEGHRCVLMNNSRMLMKSSVYLRKAPFLSSESSISALCSQENVTQSYAGYKTRLAASRSEISLSHQASVFRNLSQLNCIRSQ